MVHDVVRRPHPLVRRDRHEELSARLQLARDRRQRSLVVIDMLDHVERGDEVVLAGADPGELGKGSAHHLSAEAPLGDGARFVVELERVDLAERGKHFEIVAGAAADLEDARLGRRLHFAPDEVGEHLAPGAVPPVAVVQLGHLAIDAALHQPKTH